jgi:CBS domain-containing protein
MTSPAITIDPLTPYKDIVEILEDTKISALPVVDAMDRLVGIVSEADLLLKEERLENRPPGLLRGRMRGTDHARGEAATAKDLMTSPVISIEEGGSLARAARIMHENHVKRLPVVDGKDKVIGILARRDILKVFTRPDAEIRREIARDIIIRALGLGTRTVEVTVENGVVTLEGLLPRRGMIPILARLAAGVDGVVSVQYRFTFIDDDSQSASVLFKSWPSA